MHPRRLQRIPLDVAFWFVVLAALGITALWWAAPYHTVQYLHPIDDHQAIIVSSDTLYKIDTRRRWPTRWSAPQPEGFWPAHRMATGVSDAVVTVAGTQTNAADTTATIRAVDLDSGELRWTTQYPAPVTEITRVAPSQNLLIHRIQSPTESQAHVHDSDTGELKQAFDTGYYERASRVEDWWVLAENAPGGQRQAVNTATGQSHVLPRGHGCVRNGQRWRYQRGILTQATWPAGTDETEQLLSPHDGFVGDACMWHGDTLVVIGHLYRSTTVEVRWVDIDRGDVSALHLTEDHAYLYDLWPLPVDAKLPRFLPLSVHTQDAPTLVVIDLEKRRLAWTARRSALAPQALTSSGHYVLSLRNGGAARLATLDGATGAITGGACTSATKLHRHQVTDNTVWLHDAAPRRALSWAQLDVPTLTRLSSGWIRHPTVNDCTAQIRGELGLPQAVPAPSG